MYAVEGVCGGLISRLCSSVWTADATGVPGDELQYCRQVKL